jgi:hypothetical protein
MSASIEGRLEPSGENREVFVKSSLWSFDCSRKSGFVRLAWLAYNGRCSSGQLCYILCTFYFRPIRSKRNHVTCYPFDRKSLNLRFSYTAALYIPNSSESSRLGRFNEERTTRRLRLRVPGMW